MTTPTPKKDRAIFIPHTCGICGKRLVIGDGNELLILNADTGKMHECYIKEFTNRHEFQEANK